MWPYGVVKRFDIRENVGLCDRSCRAAFVMHQLAFEAGERTFSGSVVVGLSLAGHALPDSHCMAFPVVCHVQRSQGETGIAPSYSIFPIRCLLFLDRFNHRT